MQLHDRARAEERFFANRQESEFLARAAGLRRLGEWAAEQMMGEGAPAVAVYAEALVRSGVAGTDAFRTIGDDLRLSGRPVEEDAIRSRFDRFLDEARKGS